jgi:hypothetical protein
MRRELQLLDSSIKQGKQLIYFLLWSIIFFENVQ